MQACLVDFFKFPYMVDARKKPGIIESVEPSTQILFRLNFTPFGK